MGEGDRDGREEGKMQDLMGREMKFEKNEGTVKIRRVAKIDLD